MENLHPLRPVPLPSRRFGRGSDVGRFDTLHYPYIYISCSSGTMALVSKCGATRVDVVYHDDDVYEEGENDMPENEGTELSRLKTCLSSQSEGDSSSHSSSSSAPLSPLSSSKNRPEGAVPPHMILRRQSLDDAGPVRHDGVPCPDLPCGKKTSIDFLNVWLTNHMSSRPCLSFSPDATRDD